MATVTTEKKLVLESVRCPKGMKLPKAIKAMAAMSGRSKADTNLIMRLMGVAIHEAAYKVKNAQSETAKQLRGAKIPSSGPATE